MTLDMLQSGERGKIIKVRGRGPFRKRILEMGFVSGQQVDVVKNAPFKDPVEYKIMGYNVSLRRSEAHLIDVIAMDEAGTCYTIEEPVRGHEKQGFRRHGPFGHTATHRMAPIEFKERHRRHFRRRRQRKCEDIIPLTEKTAPSNNKYREKIIHIALVGNPNSGKTTLFNYASGSRERVGNYGGVTIEAKKATFKHGGYTFYITDLPGTYSITEYTHEELFVREYILYNAPDIVINVIDASNLERNLYLTTQLIDMNIKTIIALNMYDEMEHAGHQFDYNTLGNMIGIPFVPTIASRGWGLRELFDRAIDVYEGTDQTIRHIHINYGNDIEKSIESIEGLLNKPENHLLTDIASKRYIAIKLLEKDKNTEEKVFNTCANRSEIIKEVQNQVERLESLLKNDSETFITDAKYGFIAGALRETFSYGQRPKMSLSEKIDRILTHQILSFPIFLAFMWMTFYLTFSLGKHPMNWIDSFMGLVTSFVSHTMPDGLFKNLIVDGMLAGIGGVIIFLPNILILFFLISFMEDTGYMARAAFIMDKLMHKIGLHGKSFIPLIMGFGCNVPAIMATRTLESRNDRLMTMLIIPFMSCSARLPVYVLLISAFFPERPGTMLFIVYMTGVLIAVGAGMLLKNTIFKTREIPFVMELPPYRMPQLKTSLRHMWEKGVEYIKKIAGIILVGSIIIWVMGSFPRNIEYSRDYDSEIHEIKIRYQTLKDDISKNNKPETVKQQKEIIHSTMQAEIEQIRYAKDSERLSKSLIGTIGKTIEPVMRPLGFDWKMSVSILTGLAAKEVVVGTMSVLYHADSEVEDGERSLIHNIKKQTYSEGPRRGEKVFTPVIAFSFIIFVLIYFPCVGVIAAIKRESGSWKWPLFAAFYTTMLAWIITFLIQKSALFILG